MENVIPFLKDLKQNNTREWFQDNKKRYLLAKDEFEAFIADLLPDMVGIDKELSGLDPKQCIFRIYRDVRFSKDKSPYKVNMGAAMTRGGRKSHFATYYIHIEPGNTFAGGGIWQPAAPVLKAMRSEIYFNAEEFKTILSTPGFKKYYDGLMGDRLIRPPQGFPADFPDIDLLKYKSYAVGHNIADELITSARLKKYLPDVYRALYPFNRFIYRALADI
ncbi:MAG: DUF2461 domain-containing protein [Bacteroidales bacterium]|jgi:uncharacterized protein (TIGR02453 family)|nr:DUF2461 domain-containing protein [Bacteroidales bacterium]